MILIVIIIAVACVSALTAAVLIPILLHKNKSTVNCDKHGIPHADPDSIPPCPPPLKKQDDFDDEEQDTDEPVARYSDDWTSIENDYNDYDDEEDDDTEEATLQVNDVSQEVKDAIKEVNNALVLATKLPVGKVTQKKSIKIHKEYIVKDSDPEESKPKTTAELAHSSYEKVLNRLKVLNRGMNEYGEYFLKVHDTYDHSTFFVEVDVKDYMSMGQGGWYKDPAHWHYERNIINND